MRKTLLYPVIFLLCWNSLRASTTDGPKIWLLVIGISDYQYLNSLEYADNDAKAFYNYALRALGDRIEADNIEILLNDEATHSAILTKLQWIVRNASENDRVYIYFSGHGGHENVTFSKLGYLHAYDSYDATYGNGGNVSLDYLDNILNTLSINGVVTNLILDACHSGKIGSDDYLFLNTSLSSSVPKVNKVLSAQGVERSYEHARWGGGHGVFTYFLLRGILGYADNAPQNSAITFYEIERYLAENVPKETGYQQIPVVISADKRKFLFPVIENLAIPDEREQPVTLDIELAERAISGELSEDSQALLDFKESLNKYSLVEEGAEGLFEDYGSTVRAISDPEKRQQLKDLLISYVLDVAQNYINTFMGIYEGGPNQLKQENAEYILFDAMTQVMVNIEQNDPNHGVLASRRSFFKSEMIHNDIHLGTASKGMISDILAELDYAITNDPNASYLRYQAGVIRWHIDDFQSAKSYLFAAGSYAPNWSFPDIVLGNVFVSTGELDSAVFYFRTSFSKNPQTAAMYFNMANYFERESDRQADKGARRMSIDSAIYYYEKSANLSDSIYKADDYFAIADLNTQLFNDWNDELFLIRAINYHKQSLKSGATNTAQQCEEIANYLTYLEIDPADILFYSGAYQSYTNLQAGKQRVVDAIDGGFNDWEMLKVLPSNILRDQDFRQLVAKYRGR